MTPVSMHASEQEAEPAIRVDSLAASVDLIDFNSPLVLDPEYQLLRRLERERRVHLDLGLDREASGIGFAMLMVWQVATSRLAMVDVLVGEDLRAAPVV
jgi:hypothetical protein